jgi:hypothetical protein
MEGRELTLNEVKGMKAGLIDKLKSVAGLDENLKGRLLAFASSHDSDGNTSFLAQYFENKKTMGTVKQELSKQGLQTHQKAAVVKLLKEEIDLAYKLRRLQTMKKLFGYWHVAHLPFALIMLIILIIHVGVTLSFGYKWIF